MAEEGEVLDQDENAEAVEQEARSMGWCPKEEWRGKEEAWLPASEFVEKGRVMLPLVQNENKKLRSQREEDRRQLAALQAEVRNVTAALRAVQDQQDENTAERVEELRGDLKEAIAAAAKEGDFDKHAELLEKLVKLNAADKKAGGEGDDTAEARARQQQQQAQPDPSFIAWRAKNDWFGVDRKRTRLAVVAGQNVQEDEPTLRGQEFFEAVDAEIERLEGRAKPRQRDSKVSGGGNGGGEGGSGEGGGGKTYSDLPADAKAACASLARDLVGPKKRYKDEASWQKAYAKNYFQMEKR